MSNYASPSARELRFWQSFDEMVGRYLAPALDNSAPKEQDDNKGEQP